MRKMISKKINLLICLSMVFYSLTINLAGGFFKGFKGVVNKILPYKGKDKSDINDKPDAIDEMEFVDLPKEQINKISNLADINKWAFYESNRWVDISQDDLKSNFGPFALYPEKELGIRNLSIYVPDNYVLDKKPIVIFIIHGTFAAGSFEYYKSDQAFYKNIIDFSEKLSKKNSVPIELISFRWSGHNNSKARQNAGLFLASIFNNFYSGYKIYTIAHSHGCNVVNNASRLLQNVKIDHAIHIACPVRDVAEEKFRPENFNRLVQFYSNSDLVGALGAFTTKYITNLKIRKVSQQENKEVYNIRTLIDGSDPGHSNFKDYIVYFLGEILAIVDNIYEFNHDLIININTNILKKPHVIFAVRSYTNSEYYKDYPGIIAALDMEKQYSESQKILFKDFYKKDMNIKYNVLYRFLNGIYQESVSQ